MSSEVVKRRIEQAIEGIQVIRDSLAASRIELQSNPGRAREIMHENRELLQEGWKLKDELELLEADLKKHGS
jgi:hypothetical protein